MYILSAQRDNDITAERAFARYKSYLTDVGSGFPPGALALATSDWYFSSNDHRCPHDAWLEEVHIREEARVEKHRQISVELRLLGAYHDGYIVLRYRNVTRYRIEFMPSSLDGANGQRDWRYDEFRLSSDGGVEHEIEWWGRAPTGSWLIEAAEVEYDWQRISAAE